MSCNVTGQDERTKAGCSGSSSMLFTEALPAVRPEFIEGLLWFDRLTTNG
jgi:hypothetical protein